MVSWHDGLSFVVLILLFAYYVLFLSIFSKNYAEHLPSDKLVTAIELEDAESFKGFVKEFNEQWNVKESFSKGDDFFLYGGGNNEVINITTPTPSSHFHCTEEYVLIRAEVNYLYIWMHGNEGFEMQANAVTDTPLHRKSFQIVPVNKDCSQEGGGWVLLREADSEEFIQMVPGPPPPSPTGSPSSKYMDEIPPVVDAPPAVDGQDTVEIDASNVAAEAAVAVDNSSDEQARPWSLRLGSKSEEIANSDEKYHFLLEEEGYVLNRKSMAFLNVITDENYVVRGHGGEPRYREYPSRREEYSAAISFEFTDAGAVTKSLDKEKVEYAEAEKDDLQHIELIKKLPTSTEKRVIAFGLYGNNEKYTVGAIRNAELVSVYFPGWVCRFYTQDDVSPDIVDQLKNLHAEVILIPSGKGYVAGMFWRFLVANDKTVDRFIIRDTDSRLNARDRFAVQEWIESDYGIHIVRDHVNHCLPMSGGLWGGVKGVFNETFMTDIIEQWEDKNSYASDLNFLAHHIYPMIQMNQLAHDSYCCHLYPNAQPFPTKRPITYQHVGQVFNALDQPRLSDIDGFIRGVPAPLTCRKEPDWIYG